jgi:hypothetical protein
MKRLCLKRNDGYDVISMEGEMFIKNANVLLTDENYVVENGIFGGIC